MASCTMIPRKLFVALEMEVTLVIPPFLFACSTEESPVVHNQNQEVEDALPTRVGMGSPSVLMAGILLTGSCAIQEMHSSRGSRRRRRLFMLKRVSACFLFLLVLAGVALRLGLW